MFRPGLVFGEFRQDLYQQNETVCFAPAVEALEKQDFEKVLSQKDLFWAIFCKTLSEVVQDTDKFLISREGNSVTILGKPGSIEKVKVGVECIRQAFEKALSEKRNFVILPIPHNELYLIREHSPTPIDLRNNQSDAATKASKKNYFDEYIRPVMIPLTKALEASCEEKTLIQPRITEHDANPIAVQGWSITWNTDEHVIYPITPAPTHKGPEMREALYAMYNDAKKPYCDWSLLAKDGTSIKVHSLVLTIYGGKAFETTMASQMKETEQKTIPFPDASAETVTHLAEYLYRGPVALKPETLRGKTIDIINLLEIGHRWEVPGLVDSCTNVLLVSTKAKDFASVLELVRVYENVKLSELATHLLKLKHVQAAPPPAAAPKAREEVEEVSVMENVD